ncbi:expressed protein [Phakopsora pachyrhizi]|uniref:Expressed protein n=1 Tax=Phakopsora pachyrhizi TaxID=170000 RepID=A0AAV0BE51_PHAPC|nr:expressed protein [Phakopsora pachyrhizi]
MRICCLSLILIPVSLLAQNSAQTPIFSGLSSFSKATKDVADTKGVDETAKAFESSTDNNYHQTSSVIHGNQEVNDLHPDFNGHKNVHNTNAELSSRVKVEPDPILEDIRNLEASNNLQNSNFLKRLENSAQAKRFIDKYNDEKSKEKLISSTFENLISKAEKNTLDNLEDGLLLESMAFIASLKQSTEAINVLIGNELYKFDKMLEKYARSEYLQEISDLIMQVIKTRLAKHKEATPTKPFNELDP